MTELSSQGKRGCMPCFKLPQCKALQRHVVYVRIRSDGSGMHQ